jgi:hypothetical protein
MLATAMKSASAPMLAALGVPSLSAVLPATSRLFMSHGISASTGRNDSSAAPAAPAYRHLAPAAMFSPARYQSTIPFASFKTLDPHNHQYKTELVESIEPAHLDPTKLHQKAGYGAVQAMRRLFDWSTGYSEHGMTEAKWIQRFLFLETVAGVPGMCAGMLRHLKSLRCHPPPDRSCPRGRASQALRWGLSCLPCGSCPGQPAICGCLSLYPSPLLLLPLCHLLRQVRRPPPRLTQ